MNLEKNVLTREETDELLKKVVSGDLEARDKLVEANLRFVMLIAQKYAHNEFELDEYFSDGAFGLTKAVDTFKEDKIGKISFLTYAGICIKNEILISIRRKSKKSNDIISMDGIISPIYEDDKALVLQDTITSNEPSLISRIITEENYKKLYHSIQGLPEKEQYILKRKYGITSWEEVEKMDKFGDNFGSKSSYVPDWVIAKELNVSRTYITKLHRQILEKLRDCLDDVQLQN